MMKLPFQPFRPRHPSLTTTKQQVDEEATVSTNVPEKTSKNKKVSFDPDPPLIHEAIVKVDQQRDDEDTNDAAANQSLASAQAIHDDDHQVQEDLWYSAIELHDFQTEALLLARELHFSNRKLQPTLQWAHKTGCRIVPPHAVEGLDKSQDDALTNFYQPQLAQLYRDHEELLGLEPYVLMVRASQDEASQQRHAALLHCCRRRKRVCELGRRRLATQCQRLSQPSAVWARELAAAQIAAATMDD